MTAIAPALPRRLAGTGRVELLRAIAARERPARAVVTRALQRLRAAIGPAQLRHAWTLRQVPPDLLQQARQIWEDAAAPLAVALRAPLAKADDAVPPTTAAELADQGVGELIRELAARQLDAVRQQLAILLEEGPSDAVLAAIGDATGLTVGQTDAVGAFVTGRLARGDAPAAAARAGQLYAQRLLAQRAQLIARTEAVRYTSALVLARGAASTGHVVKQWVSARDDAVDAICRALDNRQKVPLAQPFVAFGREFDGPPAHPGCRCIPEIWRID